MEVITSAPVGKFTQGTIFSCAIAEDYEACKVHGLIITARCDVTNDKADVFNYVPVVKFEDWIERDGCKILSERVEKSAFGDLKNTLKQAGLSPNILSTTAPREVLRVIFASPDAEKAVSAKRAIFEKACLRHERASAHRKGEAVAAQILLAEEPVEAAKIVKELCQNAIAEAYYLPDVEPKGVGHGYVALLREIRHMPRDLAAGIANGLDSVAYGALCQNHPKINGRLDIGKDDFSWSTGTVASPFIEHLMQRLMMLFSRIGVMDVSEDHVRNLQGRVLSQLGAPK